MEIHQIHYVLAVMESGNFTRAAERCHVSQPALSTAIKKLEEELGGPLLLRERSGAKPSMLGELLRPYFESVARSCEMARSLATKYQLLERAPVRLSVLETIGPGRVASMLGAFRAQVPGADVELLAQNMNDVLARLETGDAEIGIATRPEDPPGWLVAKSLYTERYVVVLPKVHPLLAHDVIAFHALDQVPYVDRLACEMRQKVLEASQNTSTLLYASYRTAQESWIESLVAQGVGVALMPEHSVVGKETRWRPLVEPILAREVCLLRCVDHDLTPVGQTLWRSMPG